MLAKILECLKRFSTLLFPYTPLILTGVLVVIFIAFFVGWIKSKKDAKRLLKEKREKERAFLLPDRENSFVRERLDGVLVPKRADDGKAKYDVNGEKTRLEHVRRLIAKTKSSPLTAADRLEINKLSRQITDLSSKELLTLQETYELSDCFLAVLKLAAKYAA